MVGVVVMEGDEEEVWRLEIVGSLFEVFVAGGGQWSKI